MKMYIVAEVSDKEFDTDQNGFIYLSREDAQAKKEELMELNPDTEYLIWEVD